MSNIFEDILIDALFYYMPEIYKQIKMLWGFNPEWRKILEQKITFYQNLSPQEKKHFEKRVQRFLLDHKIKGVNYTPTQTDKILVAASAIIPVFTFKDWYYPNLKTIYLFADEFSIVHPMIDRDSRLNGLVGSGKMKGKMYLSIKAVHQGFQNEKDRKNTAIHEFLHLIDMEDGKVDGIPESMLQRQYILPWKNLIEKEINRICEDDSILSDYACTNAAEFFAEAGVHFFENPESLAKNHPELYNMLQRIFLKK